MNRSRPRELPSSADLALRGRIGAFVLHSRYDSREITAPARAAFLARFEREVDPEGLLPEAERARRADAARKAYFARLALKSARTRAKRKRGTTNRTHAQAHGDDSASPAA